MITDTLLGRNTVSRKGPLFWRRPPDRKTMPAFGVVDPQPDLAVREGDWKLLCEYDGAKPELYDLAHDRGEQNNVAALHPEVVQRLTASVVAWHKSLPPDNGPALADMPATPKAKKRKAK